MKKYDFLFLCIALIFYFILAPSEVVSASRNGLRLWFEQLLPSLLPFTVLSSWIVQSDIFSVFGAKPKEKTLPILPEELFVLLCGFLFGFPIGSKLAADFYGAKRLSRERAQVLCALTNHLSPAFVLGFVCTQQLKDSRLTVVCCMILYLPSLLFAVLFLLFSRRKPRRDENTDTHKNTASGFQMDMKIIDAGIINGFVTLIKLCGYIVFFSIGVSAVRYLKWLPDTIRLFMVSCLEVTNAVPYICTSVAHTGIKLCILNAALTFGGLSGIAQTASILAPVGLSVKKYTLAKILLALVSFLLTALYLSVF